MLFSRGFAALALVAGLAVAQVGVVALASSSRKIVDQKAASQSASVQTVMANGPMTTSGNQTWQIVSLPLRLITGATGMALGAIRGGVDGIVRTEEEFAQGTFGEAEQNPLMVPVGLIGTLAALPVGVAKGAPGGAAEGGIAGYRVWDRF